jgi:hypothetical protein
VAEQGELCAYTGRRINEMSCYIEHPKPQTHCMNGEDASFATMLACVPAPNAPGLPYGELQAVAELVEVLGSAS